MKALITGGAGFIGSHLAEELLALGDSITIVDDLSTGSMDNIGHLKCNKHFKVYIDTVMNTKLMSKLIKECDCIYHLAAAVGVKYIIDNQLKSIKTNVEGTEIVLGLANKYGKKKTLLASTSEVYGKNIDKDRAFKETDDSVLGPTVIPRWSYACTKVLDEFLALAYVREKKLPVIIVRLFNTCGPRQTGRYGMVLPRFVKQALSGRPITVYGSGTQTRCFTYVKDVVGALIELMNCKRATGEVFNLGSPKSITINELAKKVKMITGSRSKIEHIPYEKAYERGFEDMMHRQPDISKIKRYVDFKPKADIEEIIKRTAEYFKG
ncbi:MAG: GDP-mannose 4,6-dehydratase [Candidatus Omnitrophica bacterium]|nr:GDP-mannose 4,6-dehydratase [Candidatus Omnitrophota bacterium]MCG2705305.1 GDP-mannose 4,6-dehydratase [Candidatus Omnitrophota bacterium]